MVRDQKIAGQGQWDRGGAYNDPAAPSAVLRQILYALHPSYLACQLLGWGLWAAVLSSIAASFKVSLRSALLSYGLYAAYGVVATHVLRNAMKRNRWLLLPMGKMVPRLLGSVALCIAAMIAALYIVNVHLLHLFGVGAQLVPFVLAVAFNTGVVYAVWLALYAIVFASRRRRQDALARLHAELAFRDAQYRSLSAQVNPHFLFNALNSLRALILIDPPQAIEAVTHLAGVLRYSLESDREPTVPLQEELAVIHDYLALERLRFEERLLVTMDIDPTSLCAQVPRMMVQHLVENAVKHGIAQRAEGGELHVSARVVADSLSIKVRNSGSLDPQRAGEPQTSRAGSGLENTRARLALLYAAEVPGGAMETRGTPAAMTPIPAKRAECTLTEVNGVVVAELKLPLYRGLSADAADLGEVSLARSAGR